MNRFRSRVILDTDIGTDIDDSWALAMLLRCPELDPCLVATASGDTTYRAHLAGAILSAGGRGDIPIAIGPSGALPAELPPGLAGRPQAGLADSYDLARHPGGVQSDGVQALVDAIMSSSEPVTLIAIGPLTNVAAALEREPRIVENARLVAMAGSLRPSLLDPTGGQPEYNVMVDVPAARTALGAGWEVTITPLDSCGAVVLDGDRYRRLALADDPLIDTVLGTYAEWDARAIEPEVPEADGYSPGMSASRSTILFDTVAIYLAYSEALLKMEILSISVEADGSTTEAEDASEVRVATECVLEPFLDHLTDRLLSSNPAR
jgi:inosine-uridine nucleoside N-ribohydrolase